MPSRPGRSRCLSCGSLLDGAPELENKALLTRDRPRSRRLRRAEGAEPLRLLAVTAAPGVVAAAAAWLIDPVSALVLGLFVGALLGIVVKPRTVVRLLVSRGASRDSRWVPAHLVMRGAITSSGFGCLGAGAGLLAAGPGLASVVSSSIAFALAAGIISATPDRSVSFHAHDERRSPSRWSHSLEKAFNADGWAGFGAGVLCLPVMWGFSSGGAFVALAGTLLAIAAGAWVPAVSRVIRSLWRFVLTRIPQLVERVPNAQWVRPGSVFYTWVPYDSPDELGTTGKDRPVLCVTADDGKYFAVALTSKDHTYRGDVIELGSGPWDPQRRKSFVKLRPVHSFTRGDVRRYACQLDDRRFQAVLKLAREVNGSLPGEQPRMDVPIDSRIEWISPGARIVAGHAAAIWFALLYLGVAVRLT